ncbi:MAG: hypothetical protein HY741_19975 [Chloroflexi bacterium]|nr:hypothetical protein [Chloroflexota bacterium]
MPIKVQTILNQNITLLYDALDLGAANLDRNQLRRIVGDDALVMDTSEMIVAAHPTGGVVYQLGDKRIRITVPQPATEIGSVPLWLLAQQAHELNPQGHLEAYGYNFDVLVEMNADSATLVEKKFVADRADLEATLQGALKTFIPRILFARDATRYDLVLQPQTGAQLIAHLNVHKEHKMLPHQNVLEREFRTEFKEFIATLERLGGD